VVALDAYVAVFEPIGQRSGVGLVVLAPVIVMTALGARVVLSRLHRTIVLAAVFDGTM
jgi:hypothetical protein